MASSHVRRVNDKINVANHFDKQNGCDAMFAQTMRATQKSNWSNKS